MSKQRASPLVSAEGTLKFDDLGAGIGFWRHRKPAPALAIFHLAGLSVRYYTGFGAPTTGLLTFPDCAELNICAKLHNPIKMASGLAGYSSSALTPIKL